MKDTNEILKKYLKPQDIVVAAISGGPDSMALLTSLLAFREHTPIQIICAHVNHKVREESEAEAVFVKDFCEKNNIIFEYMCIEHYEQENFHSYARKLRYQFFEELIHKYHASYLMTAHHGDDLMESVLMRIARGSSLKGYKGFSLYQEREEYTIIRPLIQETKESILEYIKQNQIDYVTDASNMKDVYTRNRYRKYVLPILKKENRNVHLKFLKFSQTLEETEAYIERQIDKVYNQVYVNDQIELTTLLREDKFMQKRIIMKYLESVYGEELYLITDKHVASIFAFIHSFMKNGEIMLPKKKKLLKRDWSLFFEKEVPASYSFVFHEKQVLPNEKTIEKVSKCLENGNDICRLYSQDISLPLVIRTRKDGDKMQVKNLNGTKNIGDIFTDLKIPLEERDVWPIVLDQEDNIVWLPGLKKSKFDIEKDGKYDIILRYY